MVLSLGSVYSVHFLMLRCACSSCCCYWCSSPLLHSPLLSPICAAVWVSNGVVSSRVCGAAPWSARALTCTAVESNNRITLVGGQTSLTTSINTTSPPPPPLSLHPKFFMHPGTAADNHAYTHAEADTSSWVGCPGSPRVFHPDTPSPSPLFSFVCDISFTVISVCGRFSQRCKAAAITAQAQQAQHCLGALA